MAVLLTACGSDEKSGTPSTATELLCTNEIQQYRATPDEQIHIQASSCSIYIYNEPKRVVLFGNDSTLYVKDSVDVMDEGMGNMLVRL